MARWELITKNVRYIRHQPPTEFVTDMYRCSKCHNRVNDRTELPKVCPWCKEEMEEGS